MLANVAKKCCEFREGNSIATQTKMGLDAYGFFRFPPLKQLTTSVHTANDTNVSFPGPLKVFRTCGRLVMTIYRE